MAFLNDPADQIRMLLGIFSHDKKRRADVGRLKHIQQLRRVYRVRAIIKRQSQPRPLVRSSSSASRQQPFGR